MTVAAVKRSGVRYVEHCMGTVFTIDIRDDGPWDEAVAEVKSWLHRADALFSTYKPDSHISRIRSGELDLGDADPCVAEVLGLCTQLSEETGGYFTPRWRGTAPDPTGLVKGWAIERASRLLRGHGSRNHAINGGGDILAAGESALGRPWRMGIVDPFDRTRIVTVVSGRDLAVATSGIAERGAHIINPRTGAPATGLASVTIVGSSLTRADAYATAAFAMGTSALAWAREIPGHEALVVAPDGTATATPGLSQGITPAASRPPGSG